MARRQTVFLAPVLLLALVATACGSAPPTVLSDGGPAEVSPTTAPTTTTAVVAVADDSAPIEHEGDDGEGEEFLGSPVPELTSSVIAGEPLLRDMTLLADLVEIPFDRLDYIAVIGTSQYLLVDDTGEPQVVRDGDFDKLQLTISAYHGAEKPIVYVAFMNHYSHIDSTFGVPFGDCEGGMFLGGLVVHANGDWEFTDQSEAVFDNQIFFGDYECGGVDLDPWPEALDGRFTIDSSTEGNLVMTNVNGATARFSLLEP